MRRRANPGLAVWPLTPFVARAAMASPTLCPRGDMRCNGGLGAILGTITHSGGGVRSNVALDGLRVWASLMIPNPVAGADVSVMVLLGILKAHLHTDIFACVKETRVGN